MIRLFARRLLISVPLLLIVSFLMFVLIDLAPGDAAVSLASDNPTPEVIEAIRERLRLDDPLLVRYARWLGDAVQGDLGTSFQTSEEVTSMITDKLPVTLSIVLVTGVATTVGGVALGLLASLRPNGFLDRAVTAISAIAVAVPAFWLGLVLVVAFAVNRSWFPAIGYEGLEAGWWEWLRHLILPSIALGALPGAELAMQLKGSLTEALGSDYVLTARAKGLTQRSIIAKHALKNAAVPVVTVFGYRFAQLLGGTVILEQLFNMNGLGSLAVRSTIGRDLPVLLGLVFVTTAAVLLINAVVDASYGYFNPRARHLT